MLLLVVCSIGTFIYLNNNWAPYLPENFSYAIPALATTPIDVEPSKSLYSTIIFEINHRMIWLITVWVIGVVFFSIRFFGGLVYIRLLRANLKQIGDYWEQQVAQLSKKIGLKRFVAVAESVHIDKPIVIGYLKPLILLPVGLLSGLPPQQIEAILLHELTHIKRHDFLVNIIQSVIEVVLFFNPFVWLLSAMIREERECCCDDQVIQYGSDPLTYVNALARMEEVRLNSTPSLALAFNKNKFHVFNRIKRIMETSVNKQPNKVRPFALFILVAVAMISASWISMDKETKSTVKVEDETTLASTPVQIPLDTTREKNYTEKNENKDKETKSATYSRQVITTYDKDGTPHEEVIEHFDGDEEMRSLFDEPGSLSFNFSVPSIPAIPPIPSIPAIPSIPSVPSIPSIPSIPSMPSIPSGPGFSYSFDSDTIPGSRHYSEEDRERWEEFGREMEERFRNFGEENEGFGRMMEEWADRLSENFAFNYNFNFDDDIDIRMDRLNDRLKDLDLDERIGEQLERLEEKLKEHGKDFEKIGQRMNDFDRELTNQLVKDGYLKEGEGVDSMNW
ncbi:MAG: M56 family metallopeptidase, partial [Cyclobacteriaceae bacterium]